MASDKDTVAVQKKHFGLGPVQYYSNPRIVNKTEMFYIIYKKYQLNIVKKN